MPCRWRSLSRNWPTPPTDALGRQNRRNAHHGPPRAPFRADPCGNWPFPALRGAPLSFPSWALPATESPVFRDCATAAPVIWNRLARPQPISPLKRLESTQANHSMPRKRPLLRIAWIAVIAVAALPQADPAMEQTCRGCLDACCCRSHECRYESASSACTLRDREGTFRSLCVGSLHKPHPWMPLTGVLLLVPRKHGVSEGPPLVLEGRGAGGGSRSAPGGRHA